jgi:hypothetical protein
MLFLGRLRSLYVTCGLGLVSLGVLLALLLLLPRVLHTATQPDTASADQVEPTANENAVESATSSTPSASQLAKKLSEERIATLLAALEESGELSVLDPVSGYELDLLSRPLDEIDELDSLDDAEGLLAGLNVGGLGHMPLRELETRMAFTPMPWSGPRFAGAPSMGGGGGGGASGPSGGGGPNTAASSSSPNGSGGSNPPQSPGDSKKPNDPNQPNTPGPNRPGPENDEPPYDGPPTITEQPPTGGDPNEPVTVPEPTTLVLMGIGLSGVFAMGRNTRQRREGVSE